MRDLKACNRFFLVLPLLGLLLLGACETNSTIPSPIVRVDLRHELPPKLQREIVKVDSSYPCTLEHTVAADGASQKLVATWRVLATESGLYITAVEVDPQGPTIGATAPAATAMVGELQASRRDGRLVQSVPVRITWSASRGCGKVIATAALELRAGDPSCKPPKTGPRLLTPSP